MGMTSVRMPDELKEQLEEAAGTLRRSKGWIINEAVREYLAKEGLQSRLLEETLQGLADIKSDLLIDETEQQGEPDKIVEATPEVVTS